MRMPRSATDRGGFRGSSGRCYSDMEHTESQPVRPGLLGQVHDGTAGRPSTTRRGPKLWSAVVLSVLGSAVAVAAAGCLCALVYPILKELRAERVRRQDGTEERMLGFWSILVMSLLGGSICCAFSWMLTYLDMHHPGKELPTLTPANFRDLSDHGFLVGFEVAVLNGIMAMFTVIWSLT